MVQAQLIALLYWPGGEFMYLVLTTSTGEAITVVTKPAPNAETKWQGRLSAGLKHTTQNKRGPLCQMLHVGSTTYSLHPEQKLMG